MKTHASTLLVSLLLAAGACSSSPGTARAPDKAAVALPGSPVAGGTSGGGAAATAGARAAEPVKVEALQAVDLAESPGASELAEAAAALKAGDASKARAALERVVPALDESVRLDVRMAGRALWARACAALKDVPCATAHYGEVTALWKDPAAEEIARGGGIGVKPAPVARAVEAAGEALFFFGEQKKAAAEKMGPPGYQGPGTREDVEKHVLGKVAPWVAAKQALIEEAQREYAKIGALQPAPPVRWTVGASARTGMMWGRFAAELRAAPIPREWSRDGVAPGTNIPYSEIRQAYYSALDQEAAPLMAQARGAFQRCQDLSRKLGYRDERSEHCDTWLEKAPAP